MRAFQSALLHNPVVTIRAPREDDGPAFLAAVRRSRSLHYPWVSPPATTKAFARYVERAVSETDRGFLVIHSHTGEIVGVINLNNMIRGAFHNAFIGYYSFLPHAGQGMMYEGMRLVLRHAFRKLKLHRLEANAEIEFLRKPGGEVIGMFRNNGYSFSAPRLPDLEGATAAQSRK